MKADQVTKAKKVVKVYQDIPVNQKVSKEVRAKKKRNMILEGKRQIRPI